MLKAFSGAGRGRILPPTTALNFLAMSLWRARAGSRAGRRELPAARSSGTNPPARERDLKVDFGFTELDVAPPAGTEGNLDGVNNVLAERDDVSVGFADDGNELSSLSRSSGLGGHFLGMLPPSLWVIDLDINPARLVAPPGRRIEVEALAARPDDQGL